MECRSRLWEGPEVGKGGSCGHKSWLEEGEGLSKPGVSPDSRKPLPTAKQRTGPRNVHRDWGGGLG